MAFGLDAATIAAIVGTAVSVAGTAYTISKGSPDAPSATAIANPPSQAAPPPPITPPPAAPAAEVATEEQKARQRAAQRIRELQQRKDAPSTALSAPLGLSTPSSNVTSTVLGR